MGKVKQLLEAVNTSGLPEDIDYPDEYSQLTDRDWCMYEFGTIAYDYQFTEQQYTAVKNLIERYVK